MEMTKRRLMGFSVCSLVGLSVLGIQQTQAATLYEEGFAVSSESEFSGSNMIPLNAPDIGWSVYAENGTNLSSSTTDPSRANADASAPDGDGYRTFMGSGSTLDLVMISDSPTITTSQRDNLLTFSLQHRDSDGSPGNSDLFFIAEVGGTWYASNPIDSAPGSVWKTDSYGVETQNWFAWETNLTDGFAISGISSTAGSLAAGDITGFGIALRNTDTGDNFRIDDVQINGTIPEPATLGLIALGGLMMIGRRRSC
jgi:hypothetical protein